MIEAGRNYLTTEPFLAIAPGIALMLIVLSFNFLGDGLRDVLDPKANRGRLGRRAIRKAKWVEPDEAAA
jgi:peptide/nickel transport system permease protein